MLSRLFGSRRSHEVPQQLYGSVVAQARQPAFFTRFGFEDSVTGRFDVLALHIYLFSRRLVRHDDSTAESLNQEVFDYFTADIDRALRELGVGDTSVPKRKKKLIRTFYALVEEFSQPLDDNDPEILRQRIASRFPDSDTGLLADYVARAATDLDACPFDEILKGRITFPAVDA